jgi:hypothetical protein
MNTLIEFLEADDQMVARQLITAIGRDTGLGHADYDHPVGPDTLLIMSPLDADFFADGYMDAFPDWPGRQAVLWFNSYDLPNGGENIAILMHQFQSSQAPVKHAVIIASLAQSAGEIRAMILWAVEQGISLEEIRVESPWMTDSVHQQLTKDFGDDFVRKALASVGAVPDSLGKGVNLARRLNLPDKGLTYLPSFVVERINSEPSASEKNKVFAVAP